MTKVFLRDTTSVRVEPGLRTMHITDGWNTPLGVPNGGYALALMVRAAMDELDVGRPAALAITYLSSPQPHTEALIQIRPIKLGNRIQTVEVALEQGGKPVLHLVANFQRNHTGISQEMATPPTLPNPEDCLDPKSTGQTPPGLFDRLDQRWPSIPGWANGQPTGDPQTELWIRLADGEEIDWPALAMLCDASPPPVLELGSHMSMTVQLTVHLHRLPAPGSWVASRMYTKHVVDGMHEEDGELYDQDGNLLAQTRQLAILL